MRDEVGGKRRRGRGRGEERGAFERAERGGGVCRRLTMLQGIWE